MANELQQFAPQKQWRAQVAGRFGTPALSVSATTGFMFIPMCSGTPTGTPVAMTGFAPVVVDGTNNKLYFYSQGAWRDAGP